MKISQDTLEVINFLETISEQGLRKKGDLAVILETGASTGNHNLIDDILFEGKYLWNLHITISRADNNMAGLEKLHTELRETGIKLSELLKSLINDAEPEDITRFGTIYLVKTAGAFKNLVDLSHDLSKLKEVQTTMKSKQ